jgi:hypothetical protein
MRQFLSPAGARCTSTTTVDGNTGASFPFSSGIVLIDSAAIGGSPPAHDHVDKNSVHSNVPFDVFWDGSGDHNKVEHNSCTTGALQEPADIRAAGRLPGRPDLLGNELFAETEGASVVMRSWKGTGRRVP